MPTWRHVLIDAPTSVTNVVATWYRLYITVVLFICAVGPLSVLLTALVLWYGFGIRWGW